MGESLVGGVASLNVGRAGILHHRGREVSSAFVKRPVETRMWAGPRGLERTFAWLVRCRRLDHDYERLPATSEAMVKSAMISTMTRRLAPGPGRRPCQTNPKPTPL